MDKKKAGLGVALGLAAGLSGIVDANAQRASAPPTATAPSCCSTFNNVSPPPPPPPPVVSTPTPSAPPTVNAPPVTTGGIAISHQDNRSAAIGVAVAAGVVVAGLVAKALIDNYQQSQQSYEDPRNSKVCGPAEFIVRGSKQDVAKWRTLFDKGLFDADILKFKGMETGEQAHVQVRNGWDHLVNLEGNGKTEVDVSKMTDTQRRDLLSVKILDAVADPDRALNEYHVCRNQTRYGYFKTKDANGKTIVNPTTLPPAAKPKTLDSKTASAYAMAEPAKPKTPTNKPGDPWGGIR